MPFVVQHTPVGLLTRLAVEAGQVRRQDIQAQRDIQIQQMAWARAERGADIAARRAEQQQAQAFALRRAEQAQTFALQRVGAARIARERPVTEKAVIDREQLRQTVLEAKEAGIYRPEQIKQMKIFADLGDAPGVRRVLGNLPRPTARRQELQRQTEVVTQIATGSIKPLQEQLDMVEKQLYERFTPETVQLFRERPEYMETAPEETRELMEQQQQLRDQITQIQQQTAQTQQMLRIGVSIPEQMAARAGREAQVAKILIDEHKRQTAAATGITQRQKLAIDVVRDARKDERRRINKDITNLDSEMLPFVDREGRPTESSEDYRQRIEPLRLQKQELENWRMKSENKEKKEIEAILQPEVARDKTKKKYELNKVYKNSAGTRMRYIGVNEQGQHQFREID